MNDVAFEMVPRSQKSPDNYLSAKKLFDRGLKLLEEVIVLYMMLT